MPYPGAVVYDERLADRTRALVAGEPGLTEKKMFGCLAFLIGGNMTVSASGNGGVMVRIDPAGSDMLTGATGAEVVEMRGRPMLGWLRIAAAQVSTDRELTEWVARGTGYARSLPAKR
jgi:TfoX N-terminal domain